MKDKLIVDLDNTITIDSSSSDYQTKLINQDVALAIKNAATLKMETIIFSSRNMRTHNGDLKKIESLTRPIAENWLKKNNLDYSELILGKPWCGKEGWYIDDKNLNIEEFIFKFSGPYWQKKIDIIIPLFNEEENIHSLHLQNKKAERLFNINNYIYVDNGSKDSTRKRLMTLAREDPKIKPVFLNKNVGYGGGIKAGLNDASAEIICLNHADLQFDLYSLIYSNLDRLKKQRCLNILPKRLNRTVMENIHSSFLRLILSIIFRRRILDFNGQPKIFQKSLINHEDLPNNFCIDLAIFMKVDKSSIKLPIIQNARNAGESSWSGSSYKRIIIFLQYILWALKN